MTLFGALWLLITGFGFVAVTLMARHRANNLSYLSLAFSLNAALFGTMLPFLHAEGGQTFLVIALADWFMALLCVPLRCWPSNKICAIAGTLGVINLGMYFWYGNPVPRETYLYMHTVIYPIVVRLLEAGQLCLLLWATPQAQTYLHRQIKREPPCQFSMQKP